MKNHNLRDDPPIAKKLLDHALEISNDSQGDKQLFSSRYNLMLGRIVATRD